MRRPALRIIVAALVLLSAFGLTTPRPAEAQVPDPPRPLLLIGGTFVDKDFEGFSQGDDVVPGWSDTITWLETNGGYEHGTDLFVGEMAHQNAEPAGWNDPLFITWPAFVSAVDQAGGSTAGLAPMSDSVGYVIAQINLIRSITGASQVDVAAHSQGGVIARAAVRQLATAGDDAVERLITLGTPHYGASANGSAFDTQYGIVYDALADGFVNYFVERCREEGLVPVCRDLFLEPPASTNWPVDNIPVGAGSENPVINPPNPPRYVPQGCVSSVAPWGPTVPPFCAASLPFRFETGHNFITNLNASGGVGPVPSGTTFYNIYSRDHDGGGVSDRERLILEQLKLYPSASNVHNWNYQDIVLCANGQANYELHHIHEWDDPVSRLVIAAALDLPAGAFVPAHCLS